MAAGELLDSGRYVLEVVEAEAVNEYGPQLRLRLRVAEGEHEGFDVRWGGGSYRSTCYPAWF